MSHERRSINLVNLCDNFGDIIPSYTMLFKQKAVLLECSHDKDIMGKSVLLEKRAKIYMIAAYIFILKKFVLHELTLIGSTFSFSCFDPKVYFNFNQIIKS